jgi:enoyl-CoA hydratase/carnithine racemase
MNPLKPGQDGLTVQTVLVDDVLTVRLNRPEAAHSRNQTMRDELASIWRAVGADQSIRAVVLTGTGGRFFCAGMDLKEAGRPEPPLQRRDRMRRSRDIELLSEVPQPTIAAINGYALGGGLEMALACDIRIVAAHAEVGMPEVTRGLVPGGGGTQRLPRIIGYARACELILSGRRLTADEAVKWGIASRQVPLDDLHANAAALARSFADNPQPAVSFAKALLRRSQQLPIEVGVDVELDALLVLLGQADTDRAD